MGNLEKLKILARPIYESNGDPSHDFSHIERVVSLALKVGEVENANLNILIPAVYLHDIVNVPKNSSKRESASELAANMASGILKEAGYSDDDIEKIYTVIVEHSYSLGRRPTTIESAVLQDCDKLDGLGAIGIMRAITCGTRMKASYYNVEDPLAIKRSRNDKKYTIDHFEEKLYKLPALMNTDMGRVEAEKRVEYMKGFINQLQNEIM